MYNQKNNEKKLIVHITGPPKSGKRIMAEQLHKQFGNEIIIQDPYQIQEDFNNKSFEQIITAHQKTLDDFINKQTKPIIFFGINNIHGKHKVHFFDLHTNYKFNINQDLDEMFTVYCTKVLKHIPKQEEWPPNFSNKLIEENTKILDYLHGMVEHCNYEEFKHI